jgi:hypothetical protein
VDAAGTGEIAVVDGVDFEAVGVREEGGGARSEVVAGGAEIEDFDGERFGGVGGFKAGFEMGLEAGLVLVEGFDKGLKAWVSGVDQGLE